jgi:hypothetical protein
MHGSHPLMCDATDAFYQVYQGLKGPFILCQIPRLHILVLKYPMQTLPLPLLPEFLRKITDNFYHLTQFSRCWNFITPEKDAEEVQLAFA